MKFYHKVQYHKRKVGMDFRGYGTNSNELGAKKGPKISIFVTSRK